MLYGLRRRSALRRAFGCVTATARPDWVRVAVNYIWDLDRNRHVSYETEPCPCVLVVVIALMCVGRCHMVLSPAVPVDR
jgi:hypothetical protein